MRSPRRDTVPETMMGEEAHSLEIVRLSESDITAVARLHYELFGVGEIRGHSAAKLGPTFLEHVFYGVNLDNPYFFCTVARYQSRVIGFSVFTTDHHKVFRHMIRRHPVRTTWVTLRVIVKNPSVLRLLMSNLRYLGGEKTSLVQAVPGWWIVAGVDPEHRSQAFVERAGAHVAVKLFDHMEQVLQNASCPSWYGVVHPDNIPINRFLQRRGAQMIGRATAQGMDMLYYVKTFETEPASTPSPPTDA